MEREERKPQNVAVEVKDGKLVITVDLSADFGPSSSGKTNTVAKSGFADVPNMPGFGFNLNVWRPKKAA